MLGLATESGAHVSPKREDRRSKTLFFHLSALGSSYGVCAARRGMVEASRVKYVQSSEILTSGTRMRYRRGLRNVWICGRERSVF